MNLFVSIIFLTFAVSPFIWVPLVLFPIPRIPRVPRLRSFPHQRRLAFISGLIFLFRPVLVASALLTLWFLSGLIRVIRG